MCLALRASTEVAITTCQPACAGGAGRSGPEAAPPQCWAAILTLAAHSSGLQPDVVCGSAQSPPPPGVWPPPEIFPPSYVPVPAPGAYGGAVAGQAAPPRQLRRSLRHLLRRAHMRRLLHNLA